jgi:hypothetical protein
MFEREKKNNTDLNTFLKVPPTKKNTITVLSENSKT